MTMTSPPRMTAPALIDEDGYPVTIQVTPEVPDRVELPAWINPDGLAHPEALEDVRAEAAAIERDLIELVPDITDLIRRATILWNADYVAADPSRGEDIDAELPRDVHAAIRQATGTAAVSDLLAWLVGYAGEEPTGHEERLEVTERRGYLFTWDSECRDASYQLAGSDEGA